MADLFQQLLEYHAADGDQKEVPIGDPEDDEARLFLDSALAEEGRDDSGVTIEDDLGDPPGRPEEVYEPATPAEQETATDIKVPKNAREFADAMNEFADTTSKDLVLSLETDPGVPAKAKEEAFKAQESGALPAVMLPQMVQAIAAGILQMYTDPNVQASLGIHVPESVQRTQIDPLVRDLQNANLPEAKRPSYAQHTRAEAREQMAEVLGGNEVEEIDVPDPNAKKQVGTKVAEAFTASAATANAVSNAVMGTSQSLLMLADAHQRVGGVSGVTGIKRSDLKDARKDAQKLWKKMEKDGSTAKKEIAAKGKTAKASISRNALSGKTFVGDKTDSAYTALQKKRLGYTPVVKAKASAAKTKVGSAGTTAKTRLGSAGRSGMNRISRLRKNVRRDKFAAEDHDFMIQVLHGHALDRAYQASLKKDSPSGDSVELPGADSVVDKVGGIDSAMFRNMNAKDMQEADALAKESAKWAADEAKRLSVQAKTPKEKEKATNKALLGGFMYQLNKITGSGGWVQRALSSVGGNTLSNAMPLLQMVQRAVYSYWLTLSTVYLPKLKDWLGPTVLTFFQKTLPDLMGQLPFLISQGITNVSDVLSLVVAIVGVIAAIIQSDYGTACARDRIVYTFAGDAMHHALSGKSDGIEDKYLKVGGLTDGQRKGFGSVRNFVLDHQSDISALKPAEVESQVKMYLGDLHTASVFSDMFADFQGHDAAAGDALPEGKAAVVNERQQRMETLMQTSSGREELGKMAKTAFASQHRDMLRDMDSAYQSVLKRGGERKAMDGVEAFMEHTIDSNTKKRHDKDDFVGLSLEQTLDHSLCKCPVKDEDALVGCRYHDSLKHHRRGGGSHHVQHFGHVDMPSGALLPIENDMGTTTEYISRMFRFQTGFMTPEAALQKTHEWLRTAPDARIGEFVQFLVDNIRNNAQAATIVYRALVHEVAHNYKNMTLAKMRFFEREMNRIQSALAADLEDPDLDGLDDLDALVAVEFPTFEEDMPSGTRVPWYRREYEQPVIGEYGAEKWGVTYDNFSIFLSKLPLYNEPEFKQTRHFFRSMVKESSAEEFEDTVRYYIATRDAKILMAIFLELDWAMVQDKEMPIEKMNAFVVLMNQIKSQLLEWFEQGEYVNSGFDADMVAGLSCPSVHLRSLNPHANFASFAAGLRRLPDVAEDAEDMVGYYERDIFDATRTDRAVLARRFVMTFVERGDEVPLPYLYLTIWHVLSKHANVLSQEEVREYEELLRTLKDAILRTRGNDVTAGGSIDKTLRDELSGDSLEKDLDRISKNPVATMGQKADYFTEKLMKGGVSYFLAAFAAIRKMDKARDKMMSLLVRATVRYIRKTAKSSKRDAMEMFRVAKKQFQSVSIDLGKSLNPKDIFSKNSYDELVQKGAQVEADLEVGQHYGVMAVRMKEMSVSDAIKYVRAFVNRVGPAFIALAYRALLHALDDPLPFLYALVRALEEKVEDVSLFANESTKRVGEVVINEIRSKMHHLMQQSVGRVFQDNQRVSIPVLFGDGASFIFDRLVEGIPYQWNETGTIPIHGDIATQSKLDSGRRFVTKMNVGDAARYARKVVKSAVSPRALERIFSFLHRSEKFRSFELVLFRAFVWVLENENLQWTEAQLRKYLHVLARVGEKILYSLRNHEALFAQLKNGKIPVPSFTLKPFRDVFVRGQLCDSPCSPGGDSGVDEPAGCHMCGGRKEARCEACATRSATEKHHDMLRRKGYNYVELKFEHLTERAVKGDPKVFDDARRFVASVRSYVLYHVPEAEKAKYNDRLRIGIGMMLAATRDYNEKQGRDLESRGEFDEHLQYAQMTFGEAVDAMTPLAQAAPHAILFEDLTFQISSKFPKNPAIKATEAALAVAAQRNLPLIRNSMSLADYEELADWVNGEVSVWTEDMAKLLGGAPLTLQSIVTICTNVGQFLKMPKISNFGEKAAAHAQKEEHDRKTRPTLQIPFRTAFEYMIPLALETLTTIEFINTRRRINDYAEGHEALPFTMLAYAIAVSRVFENALRPRLPQNMADDLAKIVSEEIAERQKELAGRYPGVAFGEDTMVPIIDLRGLESDLFARAMFDEEVKDVPTAGKITSMFKNTGKMIIRRDGAKKKDTAPETLAVSRDTMFGEATYADLLELVRSVARNEGGFSYSKDSLQNDGTDIAAAVTMGMSELPRSTQKEMVRGLIDLLLGIINECGDLNTEKGKRPMQEAAVQVIRANIAAIVQYMSEVAVKEVALRRERDASRVKELEEELRTLRVRTDMPSQGKFSSIFNKLSLGKKGKSGDEEPTPQELAQDKKAVDEFVNTMATPESARDRVIGNAARNLLAIALRQATTSRDLMREYAQLIVRELVGANYGGGDVMERAQLMTLISVASSTLANLMRGRTVEDMKRNIGLLANYFNDPLFRAADTAVQFVGLADDAGLMKTNVNGFDVRQARATASLDVAASSEIVQRLRLPENKKHDVVFLGSVHGGSPIVVPEGGELTKTLEEKHSIRMDPNGEQLVDLSTGQRYHRAYSPHMVGKTRRVHIYHKKK